MAAGRTHKSLARRRERGGDDDDDGQLLVGDSQSEGSAVTGADELEHSASGSEPAGTPRAVAKKGQQSSGQNASGKRTGKTRKQGIKGSNEDHQNGSDSNQPPTFKVNEDTQAMIHGLSLADKTQEAVDFETTVRDPQARTKASHANGEQAGKQRREHEEYRKKRDADPAFIPNRGNFFMHDTRAQSNGGPAPFRGNASARGRGRGGYTEANSSSNGGTVRGERASEQVWKHDLHAAINEDPGTGAVASSSQDAANDFRAQRQTEKPSTGPVSFSSTQLLGRIQLRVSLPGMAKPITYSEVPATKYVRLPDHRPPLRRDKPVRIFLPNIGPRYIFPSTERSFIFIPRQMRPNQRGFGNIQQRNIGGYGYSSRRTSMYGGSMYSASVAASRRSSITRDRENMFSPASYASGYQPPHRPVVRLPHNGQFYPSSTPPMLPYSGQHTPVGQIHTYPLPQQPAFQGTPTTTVQHPRPQKAISVSGIESPAILQQQQQQQQPSTDHQAFYGQLPMHMAGHSSHTSQGSIAFEYPQQHFAYSTGPAAASPLSRIPEHAMHANSFQPPQQMYYPAYPGAQQPFYYPPMPMQMPMYGAPAPQPEASPMSGPAAQRPQALAGPEQGASEARDFTQQSSQANTGMVAHESNGMVFYMPATEAAAQSNSAEQYQPAEGFVPTYAAAGLPSAAPDQSMYYYMGMPGVSNNMSFHPPGQQG